MITAGFHGMKINISNSLSDLNFIFNFMLN